MKITQEVDYAFRVIYHLSSLGLNNKIEAKVLADKENIPHRFLLKLLRKLIKANLVCSYRGVLGGYALNIPPSSISLYDVIVAIDGPIALNKCLISQDYCNKSITTDCKIHKSLSLIQHNLINDLKSKTFDKFLE